MRVLVVEDDQIINTNLAKVLSLNNYAVDSCYDKETAVKKIGYSKYDLILLDLGLPDGSGLDILKLFRAKNKSSGVIILSARDSKNIIKEALDFGADDYMVKPIDFEELIGRIRAVTRRSIVPIQNIIEIDNIRIDRDKMLVEKLSTRSKVWKIVDLTKKEFAILEYLALNKDKVVSQEDIIEHVWDEFADPFSGAIRTHIKNLRKKVGNFITTVKGSGYIIE